MAIIPTDEAWQRVSRVVKIVEGQGSAKGNPGIKNKQGAQNLLVKLTAKVDDSPKKWEAESIYIDEDGDAVVIDPQPVIFDTDNPVYTSIDAAVDDILNVQLFGRPDGSAYWLGTPGGGGESSQIWAVLTSGTIGSLIGDVYDNQALSGDPVAIGAVITAPELSYGTLPTGKSFPGQAVNGSTYKIYPDSIF